MLTPVLQEAIDDLARRDSVVYSTITACRRHGRSEADTLAYMVLHLATVKAAMEADILKRLMHSTEPGLPIAKGGA